MTIGSQEAERTSELSRSAREGGLTAGADLALTTKYGAVVRSFFLRFCVAVTIGLILLLVVEVAAYWRGTRNQRNSMEPDVREASTHGDEAERQYWREHEAADKVQYQPYVLWRRAPFDGKAISIDADGIRRTLHTDCRGGTFTIWMFGDSAMWGTGNTDSQTIPSLLAADYERAGKRVCIVNYGEKGWANTQELIELVERLKHTDRKPNVVLFYDGGSEAFTAYQSRLVDVHTNYAGFKQYLEGLGTKQKSDFSYFRRTNTYRLLENISARIAPKEHRAPDSNFTESEAQTLSRAIMQNYAANMDIVELLAKQYSFRPIFTWYPNMPVTHKQLTPEEGELHRRLKQKFPNMDLVYQAAYERCREVKRSDLYYLGDLLDETKPSVYTGVSHLNAAGNQIVADRLFQILEQPTTSATGNDAGAVSKTRSVNRSGSKAD